MENLIILTGLPGSGKGVQAELLSKFLNIPHLAPGFWIRKQAKHNAEINKYVSEGKMVPDELTNKMMEEAILASNFCAIIDGFPRTIGHVNYLDHFLKSHGKKISCVIHLKVPKEIVENRLVYRHMCYQCNKSFNSERICCQVTTERRVDDNKDIIGNRIQVHEKLYEPVEDFYKKNTVYITINGHGSINEVHNSILQELQQKM